MTKNIDEPIDAVVIGSGFGGSVAALRLGQAGYHTLVLERGCRWPITQEQNTFATYDQPDGRAAWLSSTTVDSVNQNVPINRYTGVLERIIGNGMVALSGAGVGGGSLVNNAALVQPTKELFSRQLSPALDYNEFSEVYYPRVRSIIQPAPLPNGYPRISLLPIHTDLSAMGCNRWIEIRILIRISYRLEYRSTRDERNKGPIYNLGRGLVWDEFWGTQEPGSQLFGTGGSNWIC